MTINGAIAALNFAAVVVYVALGVGLLYQARRSLRQWPVSALVALAGPYLAAGLMLAQLTGWRMGDWPGTAWDRDGPGTLLLRLVLVGVGAALLQRILRGRLLTDSDRQRVDGAG